jgi:hypothetical protein
MWQTTGHLLMLILAVSAVGYPSASRVDTVKVGGDTYKVQWLSHERFDGGWSARWAVEGDAEVKVECGKLWVQGLTPGKPNATVWYRPDLPKDLIVRFKAKVLPPAENNAANVNVFLNARELDGGPVKFGRSGVYTEYHSIPNYIVTLTGGVKPGWSRVRRDPGFKMLHEADVRSEVGKEYHIVVTVQDGRLRYYLNGRKYHDVVDPDPLPGGKFALRTWSTHAWWDDVEFGGLVTK